MDKSRDQLKLLEAPVYGYWKALYLSFYSPSLYVDVGKRWFGFGILYFLLAVAVYSLPLTVKMNISFIKTFNEQLLDPVSLIPKIEVRDGIVVFDKPMPYLIKNDKNQVVVIIDTTGKVTQFTKKYPDLSILINKNIIYFKVPTPKVLYAAKLSDDSGVPLSQTLTKGTNFVFDGKTIIEQNNMLQFKYATQALIYPTIVILVFSMFVILFIVFAFLGQLFSNIFFSYQLSFKQSCRLFFVSSTPMLLALMMVLTFDLIFTGIGFILLVLLSLYFSLAIYSLKADSRSLVLK